MTQRYSHHCPDSLRDGVEILDTIRNSFGTILEQFTPEEVSQNRNYLNLLVGDAGIEPATSTV